MLEDVLPDFGHGLAHCNVVVEQLTVARAVPVGKGRQLLGDGVEQSGDDANRGRLHVAAELLDCDGVRDSVVAVKLHLFPDGEQDTGEHEDGRPVLEAVATVDTGVQSRELLQNVLLKLTPHLGHGALDLEVDQDGCDILAIVLGVFVVDLTLHHVLGALLLNQRNVHGQVVCQDELESLADDRELLLDVESVSRLEDLGDERSALEVVINEGLESTVNVLVKVLGQCLMADTLLAHIKLLSPDIELDGLLVGLVRFDPVDHEAALVSHLDAADHDG